MGDGKGIIKIREEAKFEEKFRDEDIKLKCLEIIMAHGRDQDKAMPWNFGQRMFTWVKYNNPDMEIK